MAKNVIMPALGMAQETGVLLQWLKAPGDTVSKGEPPQSIPPHLPPFPAMVVPLTSRQTVPRWPPA